MPVAVITVPIKVEPVTVPVADTNPPVNKLPPVVLPLTLNTPVTYSPVVANTATLATPPTVIAMLALVAPVILLLPAVIGKPAEVAVTPVSAEPLPTKNEPAAATILPVAEICPAV